MPMPFLLLRYQWFIAFTGMRTRPELRHALLISRGRDLLARLIPQEIYPYLAVME